MKKTINIIIVIIFAASVRSSNATVITGQLNQTIGWSYFYEADLNFDSFYDIKFENWTDISGTLLNSCKLETNGSDSYVIRIVYNALVGNQGWIGTVGRFTYGTAGHWHDQEGYAGFKLANGCIGWVHLTVSDLAGETYLYDFGYSDTPGMLVRAGTTTEVIGMEELEQKFSFKLFPNPATENVSVSYSFNNASKIELKMLDESGHLIYSRANKNFSAGKQEEIFSVNELAGGVYFITLSVDDAVIRKPVEVIK